MALGAKVYGVCLERLEGLIKHLIEVRMVSNSQLKQQFDQGNRVVLESYHECIAGEVVRDFELYQDKEFIDNLPEDENLQWNMVMEKLNEIIKDCRALLNARLNKEREKKKDIIDFLSDKTIFFGFDGDHEEGKERSLSLFIRKVI